MKKQSIGESDGIAESPGTDRSVPQTRRIALIGIIVEDPESSAEINAILHEFAAHIVGRMGIPYREQQLCIISVVLDAPNEIISSIAGKLGRLHGVSVKTVYSKNRRESAQERIPDQSAL